MGKYAKIALALLYVAQLAIAFREQLVHLYKHAAEIVRRETSVEQVRREPEPPTVLKRDFQPQFGSIETIFAPPVPALAMVQHDSDATEHHDEHHPAHDDDDKHKDKFKRQRLPRIREIVYGNLFPLMKRLSAHPSAQEAREKGANTGMMAAGSTYAAA